jgi:hypothetical protein
MLQCGLLRMDNPVCTVSTHLSQQCDNNRVPYHRSHHAGTDNIAGRMRGASMIVSQSLGNPYTRIHQRAMLTQP